MLVNALMLTNEPYCKVLPRKHNHFASFCIKTVDWWSTVHADSRRCYTKEEQKQFVNNVRNIHG